MSDGTVAKPTRREEWEIRNDLEAVEKAIAIFKDKDRLKDIQDLRKNKKDVDTILDAVEDGKLKDALGLI